jgi:hypothetical protein
VSLSFFADWASIIALLVTAYNAYQITAIKRRMLVNLTLKPLLDRLRENSTDMNRLLLPGSRPEYEYDAVLGICEANVGAVKRRLGRQRGRFCNRLQAAIVRYREQKSDRAALSVYAALQQVIQEVANRVEEMRITGL